MCKLQRILNIYFIVILQICLHIHTASYCTLGIFSINFFTNTLVWCRSLDEPYVKMGCGHLYKVSQNKYKWTFFNCCGIIFSVIILPWLCTLTSHLQSPAENNIYYFCSDMQQNRMKLTLFRALQKFHMFSFGSVKLIKVSLKPS